MILLSRRAGGASESIQEEWTFTPNACPWHNGQAEKAVAQAKQTLLNILNRYALPSFAKLKTTLTQVIEIINRRPLAVRNFG